MALPGVSRIASTRLSDCSARTLSTVTAAPGRSLPSSTGDSATIGPMTRARRSSFKTNTEQKSGISLIDQDDSWGELHVETDGAGHVLGFPRWGNNPRHSFRSQNEHVMSNATMNHGRRPFSAITFSDRIERMKYRHVLATVCCVGTCLLSTALALAAGTDLAREEIQRIPGMLLEQVSSMDQPRSIALDVMRATPKEVLDDILLIDADRNTVSWLGLDLRNITVSENAEWDQAPYQVTLDADLFDGDQGVATLTSTNTFDRMDVLITTSDGVFEQTVQRSGSERLLVTSILTSPAHGDTRAGSSATLTETVDITTGEITVKGTASPGEFWEAVAASIGFADLDGGDRSILGWFVAGLFIAAVVVAAICYYGTVMNPWGWCW